MVNKEKHENWQICESGDLVNAGRDYQRQRTRQQLIRIGSGLALLLVIVVFAMLPRLSNWGGPTNVAGISCDEVRQQAQAYVNGRLSTATTGKIDAHLALCQGCDTFVAQLEKLGFILPSTAPLGGFHQQQFTTVEYLTDDCDCCHLGWSGREIANNKLTSCEK